MIAPSSKLYAASETVLEIRSVLDWTRGKLSSSYLNHLVPSDSSTKCRRRSPVWCGADVCEMGDLRLGSASCMPLFGDGERRQHTEMAAAGDGDDKKKLTYLVATAQSSTPHLSSFGFGRALEL
nr:hypothetical protein Iba_chr14aCG20310 [Ipomoea batatas]